MKTLFRFAFGLSALVFIMAGNPWADETPATCKEQCPAPYAANEFWTTEYGTAPANIVVYTQGSGTNSKPITTNFLACYSGSYALCYYSGPDSPPQGSSGIPALPCRVSKDDANFADCRCYAFSKAMSPGLLSYVDINAISNTEAYIETVRVCGLNGENCSHMVVNTDGSVSASEGTRAPVCRYLLPNQMAVNANVVSTFSMEKAGIYGKKTQACTTPATYAGCMTASCRLDPDNPGFAECKCPLYTGPYEIPALAGASCPDADAGYVWSASHSVTVSE
ncbi:MAG: hypothetical protein ACU837_03955 [Gammaproteobacteria bacterium]